MKGSCVWVFDCIQYTQYDRTTVANKLENDILMVT